MSSVVTSANKFQLLHLRLVLVVRMNGRFLFLTMDFMARSLILLTTEPKFEYLTNLEILNCTFKKSCLKFLLSSDQVGHVQLFIGHVHHLQLSKECISLLLPCFE